MRRWLVLAFVLAALLAVALGGGAWWFRDEFRAPGPAAEEITVVVPRGASVASIAGQLEEAGVVAKGWVFRWGVRAFGEGRPLQAGEYRFDPHMSAASIMALMIEGRHVQRRLTIPEGLTNREVLALVAEAEAMTGDVPDPSRYQEEGAFLPETYFYAYGDDRAELVARMEEAMRSALAELWETRAADLPFDTPKAALTLASIIEKETSVARERPRIAGVFVNRLNRGMALQSDPTVIFALTRGEEPLGRRVTYADLEFDDPYNTYRYPGLPPGPIANPGRDAIAAALNPMATDELYFVADGTGGHAFAKTLAEHNDNVARWRAVRDQQQEETVAD